MPQFAKRTLRSFARKLGLLVADVSRIGIELENDVSRLKNPSEFKIILDVGGNHGQSAIRFSYFFSRAKIFSFEPVEGNFHLLDRNTRANSRIIPIRKGLESASGQAVIGLSQNPGGHSLSLASISDQAETIELTTLDKFCHSRNIKFIDLLKIDVEGHELGVLRGAKNMLSSNSIHFIYAECIFEPDNSSPHTLFESLRHYLSGYNYCLFACYQESFYLRTGCLQANVLFVNRHFLPSEIQGKVQNIV